MNSTFEVLEQSESDLQRQKQIRGHLGRESDESDVVSGGNGNVLCDDCGGQVT